MYANFLNKWEKRDFISSISIEQYPRKICVVFHKNSSNRQKILKIGIDSIESPQDYLI